MQHSMIKNDYYLGFASATVSLVSVYRFLSVSHLKLSSLRCLTQLPLLFPSLEVIPSFLALLAGVILELDDLIEIIGSAFLLYVLGNECLQLHLLDPQRAVRMVVSPAISVVGDYRILGHCPSVVSVC